MIKTKPIRHDVRRLIPKLEEVFRRHPEVVAVYLFGSYARREEGPLSDVDIAYLFSSNAKEDIELDLLLCAEISKTLRTDEADCYLLNKAPLKFQYEVITTGKLIYCRDEGLRKSYEERVKREYEAHKEQFKVTKRALLEEMR